MFVEDNAVATTLPFDEGFHIGSIDFLVNGPWPSCETEASINEALIRIYDEVSATKEEDESVYIERERSSGRGWGTDRKSVYNIIYEHASGLTPV